MAGSAEMLAAFRELTTAKQLERSDLLEGVTAFGRHLHTAIQQDEACIRFLDTHHQQTQPVRER